MSDDADAISVTTSTAKRIIAEAICRELFGAGQVETEGEFSPMGQSEKACLSVIADLRASGWSIVPTDMVEEARLK